MIRPAPMPQLSSAKPRSGLQSVSELVPRLIRLYEMQAEARQDREPRSQPENDPTDRTGYHQSTFSFYE